MCETGKFGNKVQENKSILGTDLRPKLKDLHMNSDRPNRNENLQDLSFFPTRFTHKLYISHCENIFNKIYHINCLFCSSLKGRMNFKKQM